MGPGSQHTVALGFITLGAVQVRWCQQDAGFWRHTNGPELTAQKLKSSSAHQRASEPALNTSLIPFSYRTDVSKQSDPSPTVTDWPSLTWES